MQRLTSRVIEWDGLRMSHVTVWDVVTGPARDMPIRCLPSSMGFMRWSLNLKSNYLVDAARLDLMLSTPARKGTLSQLARFDATADCCTMTERTKRREVHTWRLWYASGTVQHCDVLRHTQNNAARYFG